MPRVALIVASIIALAGCAGSSQSPGTAPLAPAEGSAAEAPETLWDQGAFVVVDGDWVDPAVEETFKIYKTAAGYRFEIQWKRPLPTGEPADGTVTLETDARFSPTRGDDVMNVHATGGLETTKSALRRDPDGRLATVVIAADGSKQEATSSGRNDWFIGGRVTTFLTVLCQADADLTAPIVYPDKTTLLDAPKPFALPDAKDRDVSVRVLTYEQSKNRIVAACEAGKLVGEVSRGTTSIVRKGDLALAHAFEKTPL